MFTIVLRRRSRPAPLPIPSARTLVRRAGGAIVVAVLAACAGAANTTPGGPADPLRHYDPYAATAGVAPGFTAVYGRMGLVASGPPLAFVANAATFATRSPDTSLVVVALSLPNRGLAFRHTGNTFTAAYEVRLRLARDSAVVMATRDSETVRVATFHETTRGDETIIYQRAMRVPPGAYRATVDVTDLLGHHELQRTVTLVVRRFVPGTLARPVVVYQGMPRTRLDTVPAYLARPRASAVFGVDDSVAVYLESYTAGSATLTLADSGGRVLWRGAAPLVRRSTSRPSFSFASAVAAVPLLNAPMGIATVEVTHPGGADTARAAIFVGFGPDLPLLSFRQMVSYLRFFTTGDQIAALRRATPAERAGAWRRFVHATDPNPATPQNEALDAYFGRIREANAAFRSDSPQGWLSDRGSVYVGLGEPSGVSEGYTSLYQPGVLVRSPYGYGGQVHVLVWDYAPLMARIVFYDDGNTGTWHLTPSSEQLFRSLLGRVQVR